MNEFIGLVGSYIDDSRETGNEKVENGKSIPSVIEVHPIITI